MKRMFGGLVGLALLMGSLGAWSCCCIPTRPDVGMNTRPPDMALPDQKALVYHEGDLEHLIISVQYSGATSQFAWIIPVESRPQVDVLSGAAFHELKTVTTVAPPQLGGAAPGNAPEAMSRSAGVAVLERKEAGPFDIAVLKSDTSGGLYDWLHTNGFSLTPNARQNLDYYVRQKWVFIAARIRPASTDSSVVANRLQNGSIAPLHIRYRARSLSYPLHVTAVNPGMSHMDIYVVQDAIKAPPQFQDEKFSLTPDGTQSYRISGPPGSLPAADAPTLRKLLPHGGILHHLSATLSAKDRTQDMVFAPLTPRVGAR